MFIRNLFASSALGVLVLAAQSNALSSAEAVNVFEKGHEDVGEFTLEPSDTRFLAFKGPFVESTFGYGSFCEENPDHCGYKSDNRRVIVWDDAAQDLLASTNLTVNTMVQYRSDIENYNIEEKWALPDLGFGDCEDYVLEKRRLLLAEGVPSESMTIAYVKVPLSDVQPGEDRGHAVLIVRTNKGDRVLDNRADDVLRIQDTDYEYIAAINPLNDQEWMTIERLPDPIIAMIKDSISVGSITIQPQFFRLPEHMTVVPEFRPGDPLRHAEKSLPDRAPIPSPRAPRHDI